MNWLQENWSPVVLGIAAVVIVVVTYFKVKRSDEELERRRIEGEAERWRQQGYGRRRSGNSAPPARKP